MHNQIVTYNQYRPQALAGWFSWLGKAVKAVMDVTIAIITPGNGYGVFDALLDFLDGNGEFGGQELGNIFGSNAQRMQLQEMTVDLPLSALEEAMLDQWLNNKFIPFYKSKLNALKQISVNGATESEFVSIYNDTQEVLSLFKWYQGYVLTVGEGGFSYNSLVSRNSLIQIQAEILREQLDIYLDTKGIQISPELVNKPIVTSKYVALGFNTPNVFNLQVKEITAIGGVNNIIPGTKKNGSTGLIMGLGLLMLAVIYKYANKK